MLVTETPKVSKISVQCIENLSIPLGRAHRVVLGMLIVDLGTILLEYGAGFSIRKYYVLEFL